MLYLNHGVGSSDHFNIRRKDKPFYSYFQIFLVNLNLSRMPQVPVPMAGESVAVSELMQVQTILPSCTP